MESKVWRVIRFLTFSAIIAGLVWVLLNKQDVTDWWQLQNYKPSAEIVALADSTTMVGYGRDMFYVSDPELHGRETFNQKCHDTDEKSIVLGCYVVQRIFLFKVTDKRLKGVVEVTAAHEMLHAVYERLSEAEKHSLSQLIDAGVNKVKNKELQDLIELYQKTEPGEYYSEMHSILGTEYSNLTPELEAHYKKYFMDRSKVVGFAENYKSAFNASKARLAQIEKQLINLKKQVDNNNASLMQMKAELDSDSDNLNQMRNSDPEGYNQAVPSYNAKVRNFNNLIAQTQGLVAQFNDLVKQYNNEAAAQNNLYDSLDSTYKKI